MNIIKKIKLFICSLVILISSVIMSGCVVEQPKENFENFTNSIFKTLMGNNELTSNYLFNNPENFGLERYEPSLPTPGKTQALGLLIINLYFGQIKGFKYEELNEDQQITYDIIVDLLDGINQQNACTGYAYLSSDYLGSYLGYQAQLPLLLVEYKFKDKLDVENYFKYLDLVPETFKKYVDFEIEKADNGYGMPDFVIDKVVGQCENFINQVKNSDGTTDNHFMITVVNNKIDNLSFLTEEEKETYKKKNIEKVNGPLLEGYRYVKDNLPSLKGRATNNMGLAHYVGADGEMIGQKYYEVAFKKVVGYDISVPEAKAYIENKLQQLESKKEYFAEIVKSDPTFLEQIENAKFMDNTPEEQISLFEKLINGHFPKLILQNPLNIQVKYVDKSMEDNFSPAAYMVSPIDEFNNEYIYLNKKSIMKSYLDSEGNLVSDYDYNYLYNTIAHEGIPGHLYQNVYFKNKETNIIRKVLKNSGYMEGWATYAEHYVYDFLEGYDQNIIDYYKWQDDYQGAIYSRLDMGIHYDGWTLEETYNFLTKYYKINMEQAQSIYERLIEVPNNCQQYYFTYFKLCDLRDKVMNNMQAEFDPVKFHELILNCGPIPLKYVEARVLKAYGIE